MYTRSRECTRARGSVLELRDELALVVTLRARRRDEVGQRARSSNSWGAGGRERDGRTEKRRFQTLGISSNDASTLVSVPSVTNFFSSTSFLMAADASGQSEKKSETMNLLQKSTESAGWAGEPARAKRGRGRGREDDSPLHRDPHRDDLEEVLHRHDAVTIVRRDCAAGDNARVASHVAEDGVEDGARDLRATESESGPSTRTVGRRARERRRTLSK